MEFGVNEGDPIDVTDQWLSDAQNALFKVAPMDYAKVFTVENVPDDVHLVMDINGASASAKTTSYAISGELAGKFFVYFNRNLAFSGAKQLFFTVGYELLHVSQYAGLAGQHRSVLTQNFFDMLDYLAYSFENSLGGLGLNSFTKDKISGWARLYSLFSSMNYLNFSWTSKASCIYPF